MLNQCLYVNIKEEHIECKLAGGIVMSDDEKIYNQTDVEKMIANELGFTTDEVKSILDELWSIIQTEVENGTVVRFRGVGRFYLSDRSERPARNIHTGENIIIKEHKALKFSPSRAYATRLRKRTEKK